MLVLLLEADIAAILQTLIELCMFLELSDCLPNNFSIYRLITLVRKLTEVNTVPHDRIDVNQEVSLALAIRALRGLVVARLIIVARHSILTSRCISLSHGLGLSSSWTSLEFLPVLEGLILKICFIEFEVLSDLQSPDDIRPMDHHHFQR